MPTQAKWARLAIAGVTLTASIAACDSVLDIQDPKIRPGDAGAAGEPATGATDSGGSSSGSGGTHGINTPMGGAAAGDGAIPGGAGSGGAGAGGGSAGAGGEGGASDGGCTRDAVRCGGDAAKSPEICDETGHWIANTNEENGACAVGCLEGKCTECNDSDPPRCTVCADDDAGCNTNQPQKCVGGVWTDSGDACPQYCDTGACLTTPSCDVAFKARTTCGDHSCCNSLLVPGGMFNRYIDDDLETPYPATVHAFYLDKFEVTVGRFRAFVYAFDQLKPTFANGDGKSLQVAGDPGWNTNYDLPTSTDDLIAKLNCDSAATWSNTQSENNELPVNCVSFNVAYRFCIWDGGRLPTEAEWQFAAAGGDAQRAYPWPAPAGAPITPEYANYNSDAPLAPGSRPMGDGRWGQSDLAGNLNEWVLDYYSGGYPDNCSNCMNAVPNGSGRVFKGGAYAWDESSALVTARDSLDPTLTRNYVGFRCARDLE